MFAARAAPALSRLPLGLLAAVVMIATASAQDGARGHQDLAAEAFVRDEASKVLQILGDRSVGLAAKKQAFRGMIDQVADVPRITAFVLGKYRRQVSPQQYADFSTAFRAYANTVYESRLDQYRGQTLKVTGSIERRPGDAVVESEVVAADGAPTPVNWRVLKGQDGRYRAVDVEVSGIWLAITEQQDFVSTLDNHNGDIAFLISQLRRDAVEKTR
jgi:phospholipid transport system substrate-binding protein